MEEKIKILSSNIVNYSLKIKQDDRVLITCQTDHPLSLIKYLIKDITLNGGIPFVRIVNPEVNAYLAENTFDNRIRQLKKHSEDDVENYDCFISIKYSTNDFINMKISSEINKKIGEATKESDRIRINQRRWVLLNYPSNLDAYKAKMTNDDFKNFALDVMTIDYKKMQEDIEPLKKLMEKTDKVRILGPDTDLSFSIKDIPVIPCLGEANIPDGEIYTAPVKDSVNGIITYNTPSPYNGNIYNKVCLKFKDGKIIDATCDGDSEKLNEILDTDDGSRYVGEFALGLNPKILYPMGDILYDEKIIGSIHFTPGASYDDAFNGNKSSVHWDLVLIQRTDYGGGEIYFDDVLIRKDGKFILPELQNLNYQINLK